MKKFLFLTAYSLLHFTYCFAQHCPWDCSGMILIETPVPEEQINSLDPILVDEYHKLITDTVYGTGLDTYDACEFLFSDDFTECRKKKTEQNHFYTHDTAYYFTQNKLVVKYNYCLYKDKKLFIRFVDPYRRDLYYHYIEVPENKRMHLHDYNEQIRNRSYKGMDTIIQPFVIQVRCSEWMLREDDCK
jgi:hypothetical protein